MFWKYIFFLQEYFCLFPAGKNFPGRHPSSLVSGLQNERGRRRENFYFPPRTGRKSALARKFWNGDWTPVSAANGGEEKTVAEDDVTRCLRDATATVGMTSTRGRQGVSVDWVKFEPEFLWEMWQNLVGKNVEVNYVLCFVGRNINHRI